MPQQLMIVETWEEGGELVYLRGCQASENKDVLQAAHWESGVHNENDVKAARCLSPRKV